VKISKLLLLFTNDDGDDTGLEYGNLSQLHPLETFAQLKARRESNFTILKNILEAGTTYNMPAKRLEVHVNYGQTISSANIEILGTNKENSQIVVYPFVPQGDSHSDTYFITPRYGDNHTLNNITLKSPVRNMLYEYYTCTLRKGGNARDIEINGPIRPGFWDGIQAGTKIWYSWNITVLGEIKTVASVNTLTQVITLTTDITASIASNTAAKFGTNFPADISESDYLAYGKAWHINNADVSLIAAFPAAASGADYVLRTSNVIFDNTATQVSVSMGTAKFYFDNTTFRRSGVGFSFFSHDYAGGQLVTIEENGLYMVENGYITEGGINSVDPSGIFGGGGYIHDNIIVNGIGTLYLIDNLAASWRQYSSGHNPVNPGFNYYSNIQEYGSTEYCLLSSNTSPTVIDNINCTGELWLRHSTTINQGTVDAKVLAYYLDFPITEYIEGEFNNVVFTRDVDLLYFNSIVFNSCDFYISLYTDLNTILYPSQDGSTEILNCAIHKNSNVGTWNPSTGVITGLRGSNFMYNDGVDILIDSLTFNDYIYMMMFNNSVPQLPYTEHSFNHVINNTDIKASYVWADIIGTTAGTVSNIFSGDNVILRNNTYAAGGAPGKYLSQNLNGNSGTTTKAKLASKVYSTVGTLTNVLEVDWLHDTYLTSGSISSVVLTDNWANSYIGNPVYGGNITLVASGGNITLNTFDATLRQTSNLIGINGTVVLEGDSITLTNSKGHVFETGTLAKTPTIATGNGVATSFKGSLPDYILSPAVTLNVTAGAINVNADAQGVFDSPDVVGIVDFYTGKYQFIFTIPVPNLTSIIVSYSTPNVWKNTGGWILP